MGFFDKFRSSNSWAKKGYKLMKQGKSEKALIYLNKALELNPEDINSLHNKGVVLDDLRESEKAITFINKALELNPNFEFALKARKKILRAKK